MHSAVLASQSNEIAGAFTSKRAKEVDPAIWPMRLTACALETMNWAGKLELVPLDE